MSHSRVKATDTRNDLRHMFDLWEIENFSIIREQEEFVNGRVRRGNGATVSYFRKGAWQTTFCNRDPDYDRNLRAIFFFLDRIRIAEKQGVAYQGLSSTKDIVTTSTEPNADTAEILEDAYDVLGVRRDDPTELIKKVYQQKVQFYHPDRGGDPEKFKRVTAAFETVMKSRGEK
jgi:DnaJ-domain-containing protein 1